MRFFLVTLFLLVVHTNAQTYEVSSYSVNWYQASQVNTSSVYSKIALVENFGYKTQCICTVQATESDGRKDKRRHELDTIFANIR